MLVKTEGTALNGKMYMNSGTVETLVVKNKVLFVIDTLETGGAEQSLFDNITRFKKINPVVCHIYKGDHLKNHFIDKGIKVYSINLQAKYGFLRAYRTLKTIVEFECPQLVVAYLTRSEIVTRMVGQKTHTPVIGTFVSDLYARTYNQNLSPVSKLAVLFFKLINRITARWCTGFIANSKAIKVSNGAHLNIPSEKIEVINRGRDSRLYTFRQPLVMKDKLIKFLTIGRLVPVKGHRDLIKSFSKFIQVYPTTVLHIIGSGPERDALADLIIKYQLERNVLLLGNRDDVPLLIRNYDCFIFPSFSEGFSGAVVEAMMAGLPVLASDIPANKEVLVHLETGYLFEAGSVQSMARAMCWYSANREQAIQLAANAQASARANFELDVVAQKMENYLCSKMAGKL